MLLLSASPFSFFSFTIVEQYPLLNISYCPPTEEDISDGKSLVMVAYNPLGWTRTDIIRIPVNDSNLVVEDSSGNTIDTQFVPLDDVTRSVRKFYTEAYLGHPSKEAPRYWLLFQVSVPPLEGKRYRILSTIHRKNTETIEIGPGNLKMSFSSTSGQLKRMYNSRTGVVIPVQQDFLWYSSSEAYDQASGAYIFRPDGSPNSVSQSKPMEVIRGPLVDEVYQQFSPWINQVTRLYKDKEHAEVEYTIGPIPGNDYIGKEVISRMTTNMTTGKVFYTDSNGRDFLQRVRDYRADWNLLVNQPVAGNYYPLNLGIYTTDKESEFSVLVDRATEGGSIADGEVETMLHRGVEEALNKENVCVESVCQALMVRGNYYLSIDNF
ncbi:hypothetical protein JRO89_XS08G0126900 [Xanthoceras sorbifolium]|uniref:Glycosyl hydrolase family 38 C-terminal domain-containing protein n=1 Tax=Xanthoceras sorbifolium TaxID=99658 RepID=A0ABQ8HPT4_9ROSI|nr:hypothetical protein JRO89_XS08G0126900 [Xanthoceras sorbifolium]